MDRLEIIRKLLAECTLSAAAVTGYLEKTKKYAADDSLYMREVHFLMALQSQEMPTMSDMSEQLGVTQGAVTQIVTKLERKGYVIRSKNGADKRQTMLDLTEKGMKLCAEHIAYDRRAYHIVSEKLGSYSEEELLKFITYEQQMRKIFTEVN